MDLRLPATLAVLLALTPATAPPARAAESPPALREVRIEVQDWSTGESLASLAPGWTLTLVPGQRVQLRMTARTDGTSADAPVSARFSLPDDEEGLALSWIDVATGTARLEVLARLPARPELPAGTAAPSDGAEGAPPEDAEDSQEAGGPGREAATPEEEPGSLSFEVRFQLRAEGTPAGAPTEGKIYVEVIAPAPPTSPAELVTLLYRGILLREPAAYQGILNRDPVPGSSRARIEDVRRRGFTALLEQARELAAGEESANLADTTEPEERLAALYTHLLGRDRGGVDPKEWEDRLRRLEEEGPAPVVEAFLRADTFARRHRLGPWAVPPGDDGVAVPTPARQMLDVLYQGILLRAPDAGGTRRRLQDIQRRGLPAVLEHGRRIASSIESRQHLYGQGITHEERLTALYEHLLGLAPEEVEAREWTAELERLRGGEVVEVVDDMLRSEAFARRHHLGPGRTGPNRGAAPGEPVGEPPRP